MAFTPAAITVHPRHLDIAGDYVATLAVTGYAREVYAGWLAPLLHYPGRVDTTVHISPIDPVTAADRMRRQLAKLESSRRSTAEHGRLYDPLTEAAAGDAHDMANRIARGEAQLFSVAVYVTIHAASEEQLAQEVAAVRAVAASIMLSTVPVTYRAVEGWVSALPLGLDQIGLSRTFDTPAAAALFPFDSPDLPSASPASAAQAGGVLLGFNSASGALVHWDRFQDSLPNANEVILGVSGSGKSYFVKSEVLRSLYRGIEGVIIDPEDEYARLTEAAGGVHVRLGAAGVRLNPCDLPVHTDQDGRRIAPQNAVDIQSMFLNTVVAVLVGAELDGTETTTLAAAVTATYAAAGIHNDDPSTWTQPAPLLADLHTQLTTAAQDSAVAASLAARLHPYTNGAFRHLFDGPTTASATGHLVTYSLRDLPDELKSVGTLLVLDSVWRRIANPVVRRPRLVVVDEAWLLLKQPAGAAFLERAARAVRKHWAALTVATQQGGDVLDSPAGQAIIANAATQVLMKQSAQTIDAVAHKFALSGGERQFLLAAGRGQGLLLAGRHRVTFQSLASAEEHALFTTDPRDLAGSASTEPSFVALPGDGHSGTGPSGE